MMRETKLLLLIAILAIAVSSLAFSQPPSIESIIPNWGLPAGGTNFTVNGTNFSSGAIVSIKEIDCATTFVDAETLIATSPNMGTYGTYEVKVRNSDGQFIARSNGFSAIQTVYYISLGPNGNDSNNGTTPTTPKRTIQKLIEETVGKIHNPDPGPIEIRLEQGTYKENLWLKMKVVLTGGWSVGFGSRDPDQYITIIDGDYDDMCVRTWGEAAVVTVDGVTMINGRRVAGGGGFKATDDYVSLTNNVIVQNRCETSGGGAYLLFKTYMSSSVISNNVIIGNRADQHGGGGVYFSSYVAYLSDIVPDVAITNNYIIGNTADRAGGIWVYPDVKDNIRSEIKNNNIAKNRAFNGKAGGVLFTDDAESNVSSDMKNNLIRDNSSRTYGGGLLIDGASNGSFSLMQQTVVGNRANWFGNGFAMYDFNLSSVALKNSILYFNDGDDIYSGQNAPSVTYSDVQEGFSGTGNISSDPLFVSGPLGRYYLSQVATGRPDQPVDSLCVDSGGGLASDTVMGALTSRTDEVGDSGTVDMGYHYKVSGGFAIQPPEVTMIMPSAGNFRGGEWVIIRGNGFREGTTVFFDNVQSTDVIVLTGRKLLAEAPASVGGKRALVNVEVRNPDGQSTTVTNGFRYADLIPPIWNTTVGVQSAFSPNRCTAGIALQWNGASDIDSPRVAYNIYRTTKDPFATDYQFVPVKKGFSADSDSDRPATYLNTVISDLTYLDDSVSTATKYWYIVEAIDSADRFGEIPNRELNGIISAGIFPTINSSNPNPPAQVGNTLIVTTPDKGTTVHLDWIASLEAFKYNIYRGTQKDQVNTVIATTSHGYTTEYDDTPAAGTIYFYKITALDSCNNETIE